MPPEVLATPRVRLRIAWVLLAEVLGVALVALGVGLIFVPAGIIAAGLGLVAFAVAAQMGGGDAR